jgi:outer membrane protein assembly factor BamB
VLLVLAGCSAYAPSWSAVHADGANSDYSPVAGPGNVTLAWQRGFDGSINLGPTVDPSGRVYVTENSAGCNLHVLDGDTGEMIWCADEVDNFAVASSALLDREGRSFLADSRAMHAFDRDGHELWTTPIEGVPLSAQLTPTGRVIFVTHIGIVYVLDRDTGAPMLPPLELIPGATWEPADGMLACLRGTAACPSANTLAVDQRTGDFYFTFWDQGAPAAGVRAMHYSEEPEPVISEKWTNDSLPGGSASSPDLSPDGSRLYVNDNVDRLYALDTATGAAIWDFRIGAAPGGSPSTSPEGLVMSGGPVMAVRDAGDHGVEVWREPLVNRGIPTQAKGGKAYPTVSVGGRENDLLVLDTATGAELDREHLPGVTFFSVGTTIGPRGTVLVPTFNGKLFAFRPTTEPNTASATYAVALGGGSVVPAVATGASGSAVVTVNGERAKVCVTVTTAGLASPVTAAHLHRGIAGTNGPSVLDLKPPVDGRSKTCAKNVDRPLVEILLTNPTSYHVDVHTTQRPAGELRGQLS